MRYLQAVLVIGETGFELRPPGPQPEGWGVGQVPGPMFAGFSACRCRWVALNLIPKLIPKRLFGSSAIGGRANLQPLWGACHCRRAVCPPYGSHHTAHSRRQRGDLALQAHHAPHRSVDGRAHPTRGPSPELQPHDRVGSPRSRRPRSAWSTVARSKASPRRHGSGRSRRRRRISRAVRDARRRPADGPVERSTDGACRVGVLARAHAVGTRPEVDREHGRDESKSLDHMAVGACAWVGLVPERRRERRACAASQFRRESANVDRPSPEERTTATRTLALKEPVALELFSDLRHTAIVCAYHHPAS
jgi:hypothetical protein